MFLWHRTAGLGWFKAHEDLLQAQAQGQLVVVQKPGHKRLALEVVCRSRRHSTALLKHFGGHVETLPRNWLERFARAVPKPIKIGNRLMISSVEGSLAPALSRRKGQSRIVIPASLAFGTGEHATTAMSLRFLEQLTRAWQPGWSHLDLGTGTGIIALAAKRLGASHVVGIDNDPKAISMAKLNARLNKIHGTEFQLADVHNCKPAWHADVITANLYSDLLLKILPKLRHGGWLILSGVLREQLHGLTRALQQNRYNMISVKRRGKWVAILARPRRSGRQPELGRNFCGGGRPPLQ